MRPQAVTNQITTGAPWRIYICLHFTEVDRDAGIYSRSIFGSAGFSRFSPWCSSERAA
jgi:hypothetical protein